MSNPQDDSRLEELAALQALGLLDDESMKELHDRALTDTEAARLVRDFSETAALLAHEAPGIKPPPELREKILHQLPAPKSSSRIVSFPQWIPFAIAACLMALGIWQEKQIMHLKSKLAIVSQDDAEQRRSNALLGLQLATLEAKDAAYAGSKVMVAWDPAEHRGVIGVQNLPVPPAGHAYQLWVLDPNAPGPINAGLITGARSFHTDPVQSQSPGFAVSLEPSGGSPAPTGPILFAVAPGS